MAEYGRAALREDVDLVVSQGADNDWAFRYGVKDSPDDAEFTYPDLTAEGWDARAQFRARPGSDPWVTFTTTLVDSSGITLAADGWIYVHLHHTVTEAEAWNSPARAVGVWDLELVKPTGEVVRAVMGAVRVSADVTRDE